MKNSLLVLFLFISASCLSQPETVFFNARIFTADPNKPFAEAVAIRGEDIIAVGKLADVKAMVSAKAVMKDLQGAFLMPGMIDAHSHAISGGKSLLKPNLFEEEKTPGELLTYIRKLIKEKKGLTGDILLVYGVNIATWADLKTLQKNFNTKEFSSQAVYLEGSDGHTAWVNRVMLEKAGINKSYIDNLPSSIQKYYDREKDGEPTGFVTDSGLHKLEAALPVDPNEDLRGADEAIRHCNSLGITAWLEPSACKATDPGDGILPAYQYLITEKKLTAHVAAALVADPNLDAQTQISRLKSLQAKYDKSNDFHIIGFKIFADGVLEYPAQTAAISIPYTNGSTNGKLLFDTENFKSFVTLVDKQNLLVHVHAIGDLAVTETLNGFEFMRKMNGNSILPHSITHLQLILAKDISRFQMLNILPVMQLRWAFGDVTTVDIVKPYIDPSLFKRQYPAKSLQRAGAFVCGASDWPVSTANPFEAMATAETRSGNRGVLDSTERMSRNSMLYAYTLNAAMAILMDKRIGSIQAGKSADIIMVDRDLTKVSSAELSEAKILWTMFRGQTVYTAPKK
ncbi:amidohydrolase [Pollutibacter soli]|uniref:amidohydrolase n=1 Tax=Pollutibacter soli TaxID=3034157 RepID=UPI003013F6EF